MPRSESLLFCPLHHSSTPSSSSSTASAISASVSLPPPMLMSAWSHHYILTRAPCVLSVPSQSSRSDHVEMYCANVFWLLWIYSPIVCKPASSLAVAAEMYSHFPTVFCRSIYPVRSRSTWSWNPFQDPAHAGNYHPCLHAKEQYRLHHGFKEKYGHPQLRPLLAEDYLHPLPHLPWPWQILTTDVQYLSPPRSPSQGVGAGGQL